MTGTSSGLTSVRLHCDGRADGERGMIGQVIVIDRLI
jgi:hypothetical protein